MTNRIKGIDPFYCGNPSFNTEERTYLRRPATSRHPFFRDLCLDYVDSGIDRAQTILQNPDG